MFRNTMLLCVVAFAYHVARVMVSGLLEQLNRLRLLIGDASPSNVKIVLHVVIMCLFVVLGTHTVLRLAHTILRLTRMMAEALLKDIVQVVLPRGMC